MSPKRKDGSGGVITFHTPFPVSLLRSEERLTEVKDATESRGSLSQPSARTRCNRKCERAEKKDEASPSRPKPGARLAWLSPTALRRTQAKMEAESQQVKEVIQPLLDAENGFMKGLEKFLSHHDVTELRRRELLHKRWTERTWLPLQRRVEERVSSCRPVVGKSLYSNSHPHCNTKLGAAVLKDPLCPQSHERQKDGRTARYCAAAYKYSLPRGNRPLSTAPESQANVRLQASSNYPSCASRKTPAKDETEGRKTSRLDTIPYHIRATATQDGRCHQPGCWFSERGGRQQPAAVHQSETTSK